MRDVSLFGRLPEGLRVTVTMSEQQLRFPLEPRIPIPETSTQEPTADDLRRIADRAARQYSVDPLQNVVLEASAGTGKTSVLVDRYVNLLRAGVDSDHILAITFTRKAAAEMRERITDRLREASRLSERDLRTWRDLRTRLGDIAISTIDAFCLALLREFPLEADVDPAFDLADDTEAPRLVAESLDRALRLCRGVARDDEDVALVFAHLGERRLRAGLDGLLQRRLFAPRVLRGFLDRGPRDLTASIACRRAAENLRDVLRSVAGGTGRFLDDGPTRRREFAMLADDIRTLCHPPDTLQLGERSGQAAFRVLIDGLRGYFLKQDGHPRGPDFAGTGLTAADCASPEAWKRHRRAASELAPSVADVIHRFRRDLNVVLSRGLWRVYSIALGEYQRMLESLAVLDFAGVLERAVALLKQMDEFAESRFRLEARYRQVLVDEFQDTSRAQWELVAELVRTWGEGLGAGNDALPPSIFIVADRKQSIYGFRDAEVGILDEAAAFIAGLRREGDPRRAISLSFRADPLLLSFVNDLFAEIAAEGGPANRRPDAFRYHESDRFPVHNLQVEEPRLGLITGESVTSAAENVAAEIERVLEGAVVRDRTTGVRRRARPADIAILFRSRDAHRDFEKALARRAVLTYVYKGLGFFEADEVRDVVGLLKYLADPRSDLQAATLLRSRLVRLSDVGLAQLAPNLAAAILGNDMNGTESLSDEDRRVVEQLRASVSRWLSWVDRLTPAELLTRILSETGYAYETRGPGRQQARENLKKLGGIVRRFQNRGYATLARVARHLDELAIGDESNAAIDASDAVSLMTVHAAKGLEFPIVFVVNMGRGTGNTRAPVRVNADLTGEPSVAVADYQSEADEDAEWRDREETKRLLYVALTRARDRLYLSAIVQAAGCRMGRGSLGDVLPASFRSLFVEAAAEHSSGAVRWPGADGRVHEFGVPRSTADSLKSSVQLHAARSR
jgi:ATP-dependent helicase/nuclease subunit A